MSGDFGAGFDQPSVLIGRSHLQPSQSGLRIHGDADRRIDLSMPTTTRPAAHRRSSNSAAPIPLRPAACRMTSQAIRICKQVVARTVEVGVRGNLPDQRLVWSVDVFHTVNSNDIQFVATGTNAGYFDNVGNTRRQGFDLSLGRQGGRLAIGTLPTASSMPPSSRTSKSAPNRTAQPTRTATSRFAPAIGFR